MPETYQIRSIAVLKTRPETSQWISFPVDETLSNGACISGANGTGKTTLLEDLHQHFTTDGEAATGAPQSPEQVIITTLSKGEDVIHRITIGNPAGEHTLITYPDSDWLREHLNTWENQSSTVTEIAETLTDEDAGEPLDESLEASRRDVLYFSTENEFRGVAVQPALPRRLGKHFSDRRDQFLLFLAETATQQKKVADAIAEFREKTPNLLEELSAIWNDALENSPGITFLSNTATFAHTATGEPANFSSLSPSLKRFLSRTGSLFLNFRLPGTAPALVLIDEPELGITPELSQHFLRIAKEITADKATQLIISTKSPDIEASFPGPGRITLKIDEAGTRTTVPPTIIIEDNSKETSPEKTTSGITRGHNKIALSKLKRAIEETDDQDELANLVDELMSLRKL
ncbi:MAG: AAA family ATPase [Verrucomicrobiales bacterium]|nr:AAA family ATPase [Verrucomicrobiales bacterium]